MRFGCEKTPPQRLLQQIEPHESGKACRQVRTPAPRLPVRLYLSDARRDRFVVDPVRAAMERQERAPGTVLRRWKKQPIAPEVVETDSIPTDSIDKLGEDGTFHDLAGQQVMTLHVRTVAGIARSIHDTKAQGGPHRFRAGPAGSRSRQPDLPTSNTPSFTSGRI